MICFRFSLYLTGLVFLLVGDQIQGSAAFAHHTNIRRTSAGKTSLITAQKGTNGDEPKEADVVTRASWYAVEAFGKLFGSKGAQKAKDEGAPSASAASFSLDNPPQSVAETMARIKQDNERDYFLSGEIDKLIYDDECEFADPFVSFKGRDRFVDNLENLGSFITEYSAKPLSYEELPDNAVQTKFMVKLQLNLPWKPVLAWPWGVRCEIDPDTNLVVLHEESWDIEALEVSHTRALEGLKIPTDSRTSHIASCFLFITGRQTNLS